MWMSHGHITWTSRASQIKPYQIMFLPGQLHLDGDLEESHLNLEGDDGTVVWFAKQRGKKDAFFCHLEGILKEYH